MAGMMDFLQSASNEAAGTVAAPVDIIAWLMRKAGMPVQRPVGGSEWMEAKGLKRPVKQSAASLAGSTAGLLSPVAAAAKAPQIARGLLQAGDNLAAPRTLNPQTGAIVWHGSPHKFDKFDSSKIGTGEGAQAYGHGLYLAESPAVAKSYQEALSSTGAAKRTVAQSSGDLDAALQAAQSSVDGYRTLVANGGGGDMRRAQGMLSIAEKKLSDIQRMKAGLPEETGALYKVDLPDDQIARMLDWDKPLSQQAPGVQNALKAAGIDPAKHGGTGSTLISELKGQPGIADMPWMGGQESYLKRAGIPGIRYLDGGSRGAGTGTSNYVVFPGNENLLKILERNGQALP